MRRTIAFSGGAIYKSTNSNGFSPNCGSGLKLKVLRRRGYNLCSSSMRRSISTPSCAAKAPALHRESSLLGATKRFQLSAEGLGQNAFFPAASGFLIQPGETTLLESPAPIRCISRSWTKIPHHSKAELTLRVDSLVRFPSDCRLTFRV